MNISDFIINHSFAQTVAEASGQDKMLFFPPGEYHIHPGACTKRYCYFSNNDEGAKDIAILLEDLDGFTVSGYGATLIFHGRISPLCAIRCRNLKVEGLSIDFEDSFVSDADLVRREDGIAWFRFAGKHQVRDGKMVFTDDFYNNLGGFLQFFPYSRELREIPFDARSVLIANQNVLWHDGLIGFMDCFGESKSDAFIVKHELRLCPGLVFDGCENLRLKDVTVHHAAGMGFLIQNSENCEIDGAVVEPRGRRASVSDDALHIADCRGAILVKNCRFSGNLDDTINIHGVFRKLKSRIPGGKMYYLEAGHYQQQGVFNVKAGDVLELRNRQTGEPYNRIEVKSIQPINKAMIKVDLDESELSERFIQGDPALVLGTMADLTILNTHCSPLNGRGILASGLKNLLISGCTIHSAHAGVFISGDHGFWYESGPVEKAVIENNTFDNCDYSLYGPTQEPLAVFPELDKLAEDFYYHDSITVRNNRFRAARRTLISVMSTREVNVSDNEWELDERYPFVPRQEAGYHFTTADSPTVAILHCRKVISSSNWKEQRTEP